MQNKLKKVLNVCVRSFKRQHQRAQKIKSVVVVHAPVAGVSPPPPLHLFRQKKTKPRKRWSQAGQKAPGTKCPAVRAHLFIYLFYPTAWSPWAMA
jgi:hypothetical protein